MPFFGMRYAPRWNESSPSLEGVMPLSGGICQWPVSNYISIRSADALELDVAHCFKGWKLSQPHASRKGFALVLDLSALDVGILLHDARKRGQKRSAMQVDQE